MRPTWLIENFLGDTNTAALIGEVKKQGMNVVHIEYSSENPDGKWFGEEPSGQGCVIFHGSLQLGLRLQRSKEWIPGVIMNLNDFCCHYYYSRWGKFMLNNDYGMFPIGELERMKKHLATDAERQGLFIRPDSGFKQFTGVLIRNADDLVRFIEDNDPYKSHSPLFPEGLVLISTGKNILNEWRFVVCGRDIISGCQYMENGQNFEVVPTADDIPFNEATIYLRQVLSEVLWHPTDELYVVDVAQCEKNNQKSLHVLEINSFSCADFYVCPLENIVREASKFSEMQWMEESLWK